MKHILALLLLVLLFINSINSQYQDDPCEVFQLAEGFISSKGSVPQTCWKIVPPTDRAYLLDDISVTLLNATIPVDNVIKFVGGSNILTDNPIITYYNGTYKVGDSVPISTNQGLFIIFLDGTNNETASFSVIFTSGSEKHLKPSVIGLLSVAVAFAVPFVLFIITKCLLPNSTSKPKALKVKKVVFWIGLILGLVFLAMILSRKVV